MCLRKPLPELARYLLAESLTAEIVRADPRRYSLMVARSPGWPDWLRLLLVRPLAYGAAEGLASPREALVELGRHHDPAIRLWADFARSASRTSPPIRPRGRSSSARPRTTVPTASWPSCLREALRAEGAERARSWTAPRSGSAIIIRIRPDSGRRGRSGAIASRRNRPRNCSRRSEAGAVRDAVPSSPRAEPGKERRR